jgi:hypothetical protein
LQLQQAKAALDAIANDENAWVYLARKLGAYDVVPDSEREIREDLKHYKMETSHLRKENDSLREANKRLNETLWNISAEMQQRDLSPPKKRKEIKNLNILSPVSITFLVSEREFERPRGRRSTVELTTDEKMQIVRVSAFNCQRRDFEHMIGASIVGGIGAQVYYDLKRAPYNTKKWQKQMRIGPAFQPKDSPVPDRWEIPRDWFKDRILPNLRITVEEQMALVMVKSSGQGENEKYYLSFPIGTDDGKKQPASIRFNSAQ